MANPYIYQDKIDSVVEKLTQVFRQWPDKREANFRVHGVMEELSHDAAFLTAVLEKHLHTPGALNRKNYPVVCLDVALNPYFSLSFNCWIPLPSRDTHISTKAIHHHGNMLLTTSTLFGPGYEHWTFALPVEIDAARERFAMNVIEQHPHPLHHVAFVDSYIAHVPFYPSSLTITAALWSNQFQTTWKDRVKRLSLFQGREDQLRQVMSKLGFTKALDLKVIDTFDFYPVEDGFVGMKEREEFQLGPNADYLHSLFHVIQQTGNDGLAPIIQTSLETDQSLENPDLIQRLTHDLQNGIAIEGQLSEGHFNIPHANFTKTDVERALAVKPHASLKTA